MAAASGSNAPIINDALVAWPPPPSRSLFGGPSPPQSARSPRFSLAAPSPSYGGPFSPNGTSLEPLEPAHDSEPGASAPCSPKGKERALTIDVDYDGVGAEGDGFAPRCLDYGDRRVELGAGPRRPLTPAQLGRIAQSFGIMSPNVGLGVAPGSSGDASVSSPMRSTTPSRSIPLLSVPPQNLVAVVPPANLLPVDHSLDPAEQRERLRRFRRGRLLPLQPTLGAMLTIIAREFGLPSTLGVNVYLGANWGGDVREELLCSRSSASGSSDDDDPGPLITSHTWPSLVARIPRSPSPATTPSTTPRKVKGGRSFGVTSSFSSSPLTAVGDSLARAASPGEKRVVDEPSPFRASQGSSSASSFSPRTPGSFALSTVSQMPVFGTIEFDVDPSEARWLPSWLKNGGPIRRRVVSDSAAADQAVLKERDLGSLTNAAAGIRNLTLVERLKDERPKFLRDMEERERAVERAREAEREAKIAAAAAAQRAADLEERRRRAEEARMEEEARLRAETEAAAAEEEERRRKDMEVAEEERRRAEEERRLEIEAAAAAAAAAAVEQERRRAAAERAVEEEERRRKEAEVAEEERIRAEEERRIAIEAAAAAAAAAAVEQERRRVAAERAEEERQRAEAQRVAEEERKRVAAEEAAEAERQRVIAEEAAEAERQRVAAEEAAEAERRRVAAEEAAEAERQRVAAEEAAEAERQRIAAEEAAEAERQRIAAEEAAEAERQRIAAEEAAEAERAESIYSGSSISASPEQNYAALSDGESTYSASPETTTRTLDDPMDDLAGLRAERERSGPLTELDIGTSRALEGPVPETQEKVPPSTSQDSLNEVVALLNVVDANPEVLSDPTLASPKPDQPATELLASPEIEGSSQTSRSVSSPLPQPKNGSTLASPFVEDSRLTSPTGYPTRSTSRALAEFPVSPGDSSLTSPAGGVSPSPAINSPALAHLRTDLNDNRASGQVMEDQLNNLERMMRDLSPRELEFTESLPVPGKSPETWVNELPPRGSSRLPYLQPDDARLSMMPGARAVSAPTQHRPRPSLASSTASPPMARVGGSPADALSRFPATVSTPSPGMVMKSPGNLSSVSSGATPPAPPRPARPPTPDLTGVELAPHHLPAGLAARVDKSPSNPPRARPNSISLRGLKRTVSKTVLRPQRTGNSSSAETIGIFPRAGPDLPPSSFASVRPDSSHPREGSGDSDDGRIRSRLFSFGGRRRRESGEHVISHISSPIAASHKHVTPAELVAAAPPAVVSALNPASHTPRETPTAAPAQLFAPLPPTPGQLNPPTLPASGSSTSLDRDSLNSPSSPRNVRRKPVPSIEGGSVNSHSEPDPISL